MYEDAMLTEQQVKLCVRPKPQWLPQSVWKWILGRLIYMEIRPIGRFK